MFKVNNKNTRTFDVVDVVLLLTLKSKYYLAWYEDTKTNN